MHVTPLSSNKKKKKHVFLKTKYFVANEPDKIGQGEIIVVNFLNYQIFNYTCL